MFWSIAELGLQVRSQIRFGASIFNAASAETTYVENASLGLKTLRPNATIQGSQSTIKTNSLGLRSPEITEQRSGNEFRIAILGASTVMGTYTRNNDDTLSARLGSWLQERMPGTTVRVINAGIAGASISDQQTMLEKVVVPLTPDLVIWYPGFNDISAYCAQNRKEASTRPLIFRKITLPSWLLSIELLTKNTVWLRTAAAGRTDVLDVSTLDLSHFRQDTRALLQAAQKAHLPVLVLTVARAFRRDMPQDEQEALSETARYYNHCFDLNGLHDVYDRHNNALEQAADSLGVPSFRFDRHFPGGARNFGDASHFSIGGTRRAARLIAEALADQHLIPESVTPADAR